MYSGLEDPTWQEGEASGRSSVDVRSDEARVRAGVAESTVALTDEQRAVNAMIGEGHPFDEIEDYINALALPSAQLGALWLLAWTEATDSQTRNRLVADTIAALRDSEPPSNSGRFV
jgi:hypothetical protein